MVMAGNWPWWLIDSGWTGVVVHFAKAESGTSPPVVGDLTKILSSVGDVALQSRQDLHDHYIARKLGEILRDLPLPKGVVERIVDHLRGETITRGLVAIESQSQRRAVRLLV